jgi:Mobilization protein NikA
VRPGRPRVDPALRRERRVTVQVTAAELEEIEWRAAQLSLSRSTYMQRAALARPLPRPVPAINRAQWVELARLAANLNQIAHAINAGTAPPVFEAGAVRRLEELLIAVRAALLGGA